jgi:phenylacetate-coenzyme A ligase PaaK-like adenylate-forming protein
VKLTPLEAWIGNKIGVGPRLPLRSELQACQLERLNQTIRLAGENSRFYAQRLAGLPAELSCLEDFARFPLTSADELRQAGLQLLCVSQSQVERIVTLDTSGTTGSPKRIYFTRPDQELTIDFFQHGMSTFTRSGDRVMILLPHERPGSVGDLLSLGLKRLGAAPVRYGPVRDPEQALFIMQAERVNILVGAPVNVLTLARFWEAHKQAAWIKPQQVLLSTDHVPQAIVNALEEIWGCKVYNHYGMTEMGLGGGVECQARRGYHLREADLYFEIVDSHTGQVLPDGEMGEVVFTTLTRQGMPLIRYRTGDLSHFIPGPCACGTVLHTLEKVAHRLDGKVVFRNSANVNQVSTDGLALYMADLDETLFPIRELLNFSACLIQQDGRDCLTLKTIVLPGAAENVEQRVLQRLATIPAIRTAQQVAGLELCVQVQAFEIANAGSLAKRVILDRRGENR